MDNKEVNASKKGQLFGKSRNILLPHQTTSNNRYKRKAAKHIVYEDTSSYPSSVFDTGSQSGKADAELVKLEEVETKFKQELLDPGVQLLKSIDRQRQSVLVSKQDQFRILSRKSTQVPGVRSNTLKKQKTFFLTRQQEEEKKKLAQKM